MFFRKLFFSSISLAIFFFSLNAGEINLRKTDSGKGPLLTSNLYPVYLPFINLKPEKAELLQKGSTWSYVSFNYGNSFHRDLQFLTDDYTLFFDMEVFEFAVGYEWGITKRLNLGFDYIISGFYGGIFDNFIQDFHGFFDFPNHDRERVQDGDFSYIIENENGSWIYQSNPDASQSQVIIRSKYLLFQSYSNNFILSLQGAVKLPLTNGDPTLSNNKTDYALNLMNQIRFGHLCIYLTGGWIYLGKPDELYIFDFKNNLFNFLAAFEYSFSKKFSLITQVDGSTSPYKSGHIYLDSISSTINTGCKWRIFEDSFISISLAEEIFSFATTDILLTCSLEHSY